MAFLALLAWMGVTDVPSYFQKLRLAIVISVIVCAFSGASSHGLTGFVLGGLLGLAAPAALLWLAVLLTGIVIYLGIYLLAWAVVWSIFKWFLSNLLAF